jgi:hypothetical protein
MSHCTGTSQLKRGVWKRETQVHVYFRVLLCTKPQVLKPTCTSHTPMDNWKDEQTSADAVGLAAPPSPSPARSRPRRMGRFYFSGHDDR